MLNQKVFNFGIIGTGRIATKMAEALQFVEGAKLYAIASRTQQVANDFAKTYNVEKAYGSYESMLSDPLVHVVYIATPHNLHFQNTMLCLEYGKHVLCEKPFAVNAKEVRTMIEKAKERKLFLMEAMWSRFLPHIIEIKNMITSGKLGEIKLLTSNFCMKFNYDPRNRKFNKDLIGGSLMDIGIYPVFLALFLLGKPKTISAVAGIGETGVDFNCSISFAYDDEKTSVMYSSMIADAGVKSFIYGEKGTIEIDNMWFMPVGFKWIGADNTSEQYKYDIVGNGYNYEAAEVIKCLKEGKTQSELMTWDMSMDLIETLDTIRKQCNIHYLGHD